MSTQLIGFENLPNIYITKIILEDKTKDTLNVSVDLEMLDRSVNGAFVWSDNEVITPFIKVCLVHTVDQSISQRLTSGQIIPLPNLISTSQGFDSKTTKIHQLSIREFKKSLEDNVVMFRRKLVLEQPETEFSSIFALTFLDTRAIAEKFKVDMSGRMSQYHGAVASEKIMENGVVPKTTNVFISSNNTLWTGPVHFHPSQGYMQGSFHTNQPHGKLRVSRVNNIKLIDNREIKYSPKKQAEDLNNPLISEMYHSVDSMDNLTGFFTFNVRQFVLSKTKYGRKMLGLSARLFNNFVNSVEINSISISKHMVRTRRAANHLGTPAIAIEKFVTNEFIDSTIDSSPGVLSNTDSIKQVYLNSDNSVRNYTFFDTTGNSGMKTDFVYKVHISIIDRSQEFMNTEIRNLMDKYNELQDLLNLLSSPRSYDFSNNKLKSGVTIPDTIIPIIEKYYNCFSMFNNINPAEINRMIATKASIFTSGNYTVNLGDKFKNDYEKLVTTFLDNFKIMEEQGGTTKPKNIQKRSMPTIIEVSKTFSEIVNFSDYRRSYNYLGLETSGLKVVSMDSYKQRGQQEVDKFFDTSKSYVDESLQGVDVSISAAITDFSKSKFLFFSPNTFKFDKEKVDLKDLGGIDDKKLNSVFLKSAKANDSRFSMSKSFKAKKGGLGNPFKRKGNSKKVSKYVKRFSFKRVPPVTKVKDLKESIELQIDSNEYLGDNSEFVNAPEDYRELVKLEENEKISETLESVERGVVERTRNKFDVKIKDNVIDKFKRSKKFSTSKLRKTPIAFKSLVSSRSPAAKNNILNSEVDILKNSETRTMTEMVFQTNQKIEVLAGFEMNQQGTSMLSKPIWTEMDFDVLSNNSRVVCRMVYVEDEALEINVSPEFRINPLDQIFIISNSDVYNGTTNTGLPDSTALGSIVNDNNLSTKIKYATTNIVTQSKTKMGVFDKMPEDNRVNTPTPTSTGLAADLTPTSTPTGGGITTTTSGGGTSSGGY